MSSRFNFIRVIQNIREVKRVLPPILANDAKRYFLDSFRKSGWDSVPWKTPERKIPGTGAYKYPKKGADARHTRATLVQSGRLRRAVADSTREVDFNQIRFVVDLPYAAVHNYGGDLKHGKMPQRKYMGDSPILRLQQIEKIKKVVDRIWQV